MNDVFLSYAHQDEPAAAALARVFVQAGWSVFWDHTIPSGQTWRDVIGQALVEARCVVVLWSRHAIRSHWVMDEADVGRRRGVLVPVLIDKVEIPLGFGSIQCADLSAGVPASGDPALARLLADIGQRLVSTTVAAPVPLVAPIRPNAEAAEARYRERLRRSLSKTRLLGARNEVDIESLFTEVHFLPEASATRRFGATSTSFGDFAEVVDRRKAERIPAVDALRTARRLYILGTPGAGKTTLLRHVAVSAAAGRTEGFPIYVLLKDWADSGLGFAEFVGRELEVSGFEKPAEVLDGLLRSGQALLLFDGLDEVGTQRDARARIIKTIVDLSHRHDQVRILLTCRTSASDHQFEHFRYVEVADFLPAQQEDFVRKWFAHDAPKAALFLEELAGDNSRGLRDLGRKPLFLAFLCVAFEQTLEFPRSKSALYAEAIEVLLSRWDGSRSIQREAYGLKGAQRKKQFLAQLALRSFAIDRFAMHEMLIEAVLQRFLKRLPGGDQYGEIETAQLVRSLEAAHGILLERAVGVFAFSHLSIHEYFAALGLVSNVASGTPWAELVPFEAVYTSRWREVLLHVGSLLHDGDAYLRYVRSCIAEQLRRNELVRRFVDAGSRLADDADSFSRFTNAPARFVEQRQARKASVAEDFYPSTRLSNSVQRLERSLLYSLKGSREQQRPPPGLQAAWRRLEVLREAMSYKQATPMLLGAQQLSARFDDQLADFVDSQDLYLVLLDDVMVADRDAGLGYILGADWSHGEPR